MRQPNLSKLLLASMVVLPSLAVLENISAASGHPEGQILLRELRAVPGGREGFVLMEVDGQEHDIDLPVVALSPVAWEPSGNRFFFVGYGKDDQYDLYAADSSGVLQRFTYDSAAERNPIVSPSGREVVFAILSKSGQTSALVHLDLESAKRTRIQSETTLTKNLPSSWSPDGSRFLFTRISADGQRVMEYDFARARSSVAISSIYRPDEASYSPSGKTIAFTRESKNESSTSCVMMVATAAQATPQKLSCKGSVGASAPSWNDQGTYIAFESCDPCRVLLLNVAARKTTPLTEGDTDTEEESPSWRPSQLVGQLPTTGMQVLWWWIALGGVLSGLVLMAYVRTPRSSSHR